MRHMQWTWAEYQDTPAHVIDRLIEVVNAEAEESPS